MEKVIYALWREQAVSRDNFNRRLLEEVAPQLTQHALGLRVNVQDESVRGGTTFRYTSTSPQMEAVVQLWVDSAHPDRRKSSDALIAALAPRHSAWLVCESTPIRNDPHPRRPGERTEGYSHLAFITRPPRLTWEAWRDRWQGHHTQVAIETQSNFEYVQNLIVRPLQSCSVLLT